ncbi:hypothetical protein [Conexibacter sp. SYSU D00693]|uniref:hypothetical protein n=1 Tax=Conexibacter sp. SYSU D00693 TaxID=2812560 RepID=UPI00196A6C81|nr:hypothetical protein [Conexibacter sp. SYSU D00693]
MSVKTFITNRAPTVLACVACLGVAGAGSATAAGVVLKKPTQIRNGVITGAKLKKGTITEAKLSKGVRKKLAVAVAAGAATGVTAASGAAGANGKDGAAGANGANGAAGKDGAAGPQGPKGDQGPQGPAGPAGSARGYAAVSATGQLSDIKHAMSATHPSTGVYKFNLGYVPENVQVTPAFDASGIGGGPVTYRVGRRTATGICSDADVCVLLNASSGGTNAPFFITFQ